jgi:hypothetical protein
VLRGEATNTNFIVLGLTRPGIEPTIYRTRGEHTNHYATDAVENQHRKINTQLNTLNNNQSAPKRKTNE